MGRVIIKIAQCMLNLSACSIQVPCGTTSPLNYPLLYKAGYGPDVLALLCAGELLKKANLKLQVVPNRLEQESEWCKHGAMKTMVSIQSMGSFSCSHNFCIGTFPFPPLLAVATVT